MQIYEKLLEICQKWCMKFGFIIFFLLFCINSRKSEVFFELIIRN